MATVTYHVKLRLRDLPTLLFRKKLCPQCGSPLRRRIEKRPRGTGWDTEMSLGGLKFEYGGRIDVYLLYDCAGCHATCELKDL